MVVHNCCGSRKTKLAFKAVGQSIFRKLICVSKEQQNLVINRLGFSPEKVQFHYNWIDTDFFCTDQVEDGSSKRDYVFSCGLESRDYITLKQAASMLPYAFEIVASGFFGRHKSITEITAPNVVVHENSFALSGFETSICWCPSCCNSLECGTLCGRRLEFGGGDGNGQSRRSHSLTRYCWVHRHAGFRFSCTPKIIRTLLRVL